MANSVDPDQTAPLGSWSALFAKASVSARKLRIIMVLYEEVVPGCSEAVGSQLNKSIKFAL